MLAELADVIIGVDTHTDTHTAAAVDRLGAHLATIEVSADAAGYARLASFAAEHAAGLRTAWAIEGCGSHGAGLARALTSAGHLVIEADRPKKARRRGGKSDELDAVRAARREHLQGADPHRARGSPRPVPRPAHRPAGPRRPGPRPAAGQPVSEQHLRRALRQLATQVSELDHYLAASLEHLRSLVQS
jgi:Transposase